MNYNLRIQILILSALVTSLLVNTVAHSEDDSGRGMSFTFIDPETLETRGISIPYSKDAIARLRIGIYWLKLSPTFVTFEVISDPSVASNFQVTNGFSEPQDYFFTLDIPIRPLMANTSWGELDIELIDDNSDGMAFLNGNLGDEGAIQEVSIYNAETFQGEPFGPHVGTSITAPGMYSFPLEPFAGPTPADGDTLSLSTVFTLSPGDTARIKGRFIIDEGTGIPFAEIPELPDPADGPYFNVIDVDSPETSLVDDFFIGSYTQLNLSQGGSIGARFNFSAFTNNRWNDNNIETEINVTGGTMGNQFMVLGGTTMNISGGVHEGIFLAGSYLGQSTNVEVNISGGVVAAGHAGELQAYAGSVTNISGGRIGRTLVANGGVVNIVGGEFGNTEFPILGGRLEVNQGGTINITGGSFVATAVQGGLTVLDGTLNVAGGGFLQGKFDVDVFANGALHLFGTEFFLDGVALAGLTPGDQVEITERDVTLSGLLADGSAFSIDLNSVEEPFGPDFVSPEALLTVTFSLAGDFNYDGNVDGRDFLVWQRNPSVGNLADWQSSYGMGTLDAVSVPEPNCLALLLGLASLRCFTRAAA